MTTCSGARKVRKEFGGLVACNDVDFNVPSGADRQPDRPQRCRQDDVLQHADRRLHADLRRGDVRRHRDRRAAAHTDDAARHRPDVPEHPAVPDDELAGERDGGHALPHQGRHRRGASCARPASAARSASRRDKAREILRYVRAADAVDEEFAMNLSYGDQRRLEVARALATDPKLVLLDEPTAGMNPQESAELHRLRAPPARGAGPDGADDRARHEGRDGRLRPRHGARPRREDRRGLAGGDAGRRPRDRGIPGHRRRRPGRSPATRTRRSRARRASRANHASRSLLAGRRQSPSPERHCWRSTTSTPTTAESRP